MPTLTPPAIPFTLPSVELAGVSRAGAIGDWRLHKHADYQRVYQTGRKQFSSLMTYFSAPQPIELAGHGPRVGITAGKVLGPAVERNRIKRRMRAAIRGNLRVLTMDVDVVLHPKRSVLTAAWSDVNDEIGRIFAKVQANKSTERRA